MTYATKTAHVLALRAQGLPTREIASRVGIEVKNVTALEHSAGRGKRAKRPAEALGRTVLFPADILDALGPFAARRGVHPNNLARKIVETVIDEGLVDAVLDDGAPQ
jgi:transcriptional regulator